MAPRLSLHGIRVHLSGSMPDGATPERSAQIQSFVEQFARVVLREGGTLMHGSHPTFAKPLMAAAESFVNAGGRKDMLTLVRAQKYAASPEQLRGVEAQRKYCAVQIVPSAPGNPDEPLIPMREWMAERCDVLVAIGGRHWDVNKPRSGVPLELEEMLSRGKPAFVLGGFGGAAEGYVNEHDEVFSRAHNGLNVDKNRELAKSTDIAALVKQIIDQIRLLPLIRERVVSGGRLFRILALDGGGLRGAFTAAVLAKWDDMIKPGGGNQIINHFDLVAGTSTGAILAIGLALGMTPLEILNFYRSEGPKIFPKNRGLRHWLKSKHDAVTLRQTLTELFGDKNLSEHSICRLVLPTVRAVRGESEAIVTVHDPGRSAFASISAVDAALASSAAPTYFDDAVVEDPIARARYLDGGIWANNPVLPAIAEAVRHLKVPLDRIDVLSVGTIGNEADFEEALGKGKAGWASSSADLFFAAQEHAAASLADVS